MRRSKLVVWVAGVVIIGLTASVYAIKHGDGSAATAATTPKAAARTTVKVTRQDLVATTTISGTLSYGPTHPIRVGGSGSTSKTTTSTSSNAGSGAGAGGAASGGASTGSGPGAGATTSTTTTTPLIITALPALGSFVKQGQPLFEVNGQPGPALFYGPRPMWRSLSNGVVDGLDVFQLETNLAALGFTHSATMVVDGHFNLATGNAVADWQQARGYARTGIVATTDVVYDAGEIRVAALNAAVGDTASGTIFAATGTKRSVQVALDPANQTYISKKARVTVTLPDTSTVTGVVTSIGTVATVSAGGNGGNATASIPVTIVLTSNPKAALDDSPVSIALVTSRAKQALTVPVSALLALAEGGYALEKVNGDGTTSLVKCTPGQFANGFVQIEGDVTEGETVVTA